MIKKVIAIVLVVIIALLLVSSVAAAGDGTTTSEDYIPSETEEIVTNEKLESGKPLTFNETKNRNELNTLIEECKNRKTEAHNMAEAARACGYSEEHPVIVLAKDEWGNADKLQLQYEQILNDLVRKEAWEKYPAATEIWLYLKDLGYNDYVVAGILGNIMAECGGQTLNIRYTLVSNAGSGYYGMCQWSRGYAKVWGKDLKGQCDFLRDTIEYQLNTYGYKYKKGFNYDSFLNLTNEKDAALAFAKCYERCSSKYYSIREVNATKALEFYTK